MILFLVFSSIEVKIYFLFNVYLGLKRGTEDVGQPRKNVVGKIKYHHPTSFQKPEKKLMQGWTQMAPSICPSGYWWHLFTILLMAIN